MRDASYVRPQLISQCQLDDESPVGSATRARAGHRWQVSAGHLPVLESIFLTTRSIFRSSSFMVRSTPSAPESSALKRKKSESHEADHLQAKKSRTRVRSVILHFRAHSDTETFLLFLVSPVVNVIVASRRFVRILPNVFSYKRSISSATDKYRAHMYAFLSSKYFHTQSYNLSSV